MTIAVLVSPFIASIPMAALKQIVRIRKDEEEKRRRKRRKNRRNSRKTRSINNNKKVDRQESFWLGKVCEYKLTSELWFMLSAYFNITKQSSSSSFSIEKKLNCVDRVSVFTLGRLLRRKYICENSFLFVLNSLLYFCIYKLVKEIQKNKERKHYLV